MVSQATVQEIGSSALSISLNAEAFRDFIFIYLLSLICLARVRHIETPSLRAFAVSCSCQSEVMLYLPGELILPASCHIKKMCRGRLLLMQNISTWEREGSKSLVNTSLIYSPHFGVQKKLLVVISLFRAQQSSADEKSFDSLLSA